MENFLGPWAKEENVELISLQPEEAHTKLLEHIECDMLIYNVGTAASIHEMLAELQVLHTLRREAALVILSDDESPVSVISAINCGARGYFTNSMVPALALQALSFVLHGGTYFPPAILAGHAANGAPTVEYTHQHFSPDTSRGQSSPGQPGQMPTGEQQLSFLQQQGSLFDEKALVQPCDRFPSIRCGDAISKPELTVRQQAVLSCLCRGDPNKVIGRKLGMTETTVKVHVREIMRKLGVSNRTQVAIAASLNCRIPDSVAELVPQDPPTLVKSSEPRH
ncbi:response regulator transcription factor [Bradyrhizobium sediminis]|nr:response regulator transcription factor [Bradyrhizobium sediminis]